MLRAWRAAEGRGRVAGLNGRPTEGRSGPARGLQGSGARAGASGVQLGDVVGGFSRKRGPSVRGHFKRLDGLGQTFNSKEEDNFERLLFGNGLPSGGRCGTKQTNQLRPFSFTWWLVTVPSGD